MLTNIYYYGIYKPYIIKADKSEKTAPASGQKKAAGGGDTRINLNKAYKAAVINYVKDLSFRVVNIKDAAKNLAASVNEYSENAADYGEEEALAWLAEDAAEFLKSFGELDLFASAQTHSRELSRFAEENRWNMEELGALFFTNEGGGYALDFKALGKAAKNGGLDALRVIADNVYGGSLSFMRKPLSEHMNFKPFGYYYNYKLGSYTDDTFLLVERGTLLSKTI